MSLNGLEYSSSTINPSYVLNDDFNFTYKVKNAHAGHRVPTGNPDRFVLIEFVLMNSQGDTLNYQSERIGEVWKWYPSAKKISDNNLNPLEERAYDLDWKLKQKGNLILNIRVSKHRISEKAARYNKLSSSYPRSIISHEEVYEIKVQ